MNFFETVAGQRFTQGTIPALIKELEKQNKPQKFIKCNTEDLFDIIQSIIENGGEYIFHIERYHECLVIYK